MMTMRSVLLMCALCAWCACGCAALEEQRRAEFPGVGGYAVMTQGVESLETGGESCPGATTASGGVCSAAKTQTPVVKSASCTETNMSDECKAQNDLRLCKEEGSDDCKDTPAIGTGEPCRDTTKQTCSTAQQVKPEGIVGSNSVDDPSHTTGGDDDTCPDKKPKVNGSCAVAGGESPPEIAGKTVDLSDGALPREDTPQHSSGRVVDDSGKTGTDGRCDSSTVPKCTTPSGETQHNNTPLQPQPHPGQGETGGGNLKNGRKNVGDTDNSLELQKRADGIVGDISRAKADLPAEKGKNAKENTDANSSRDKMDNQVTDSPTSTKGKETSSDVLPTAAQNPAAESSGENPSTQQPAKHIALQGTDEQDHSKQLQSFSESSSTRDTETTSTKPRDSPVPKNADKDTKNEDSSVSPVWVHAPLLLLTLFAVMAVS
ncbi:hypothetical protein DQ04_19701000 [Trypanosoma grayi]|uniref:hypothetical protein n=1 Tax=Trypanosoma grayi TaxID=71804 RepID=UPI0004F4754D|nr:hypothetical protein DQ04_19701000 [Trypanosoma grayi]KEG05646.1 hypothetical protein DQ04_19701000 [Trypanosoma grayi]